MIKRLAIIFFLLMTSAKSECKYYAEADVVNNEIINKKEHYTCNEKENFIIRFITEEKFQHAFVTLVMVVAENI
mgnify:FL=1|tara:strand:+ start:87 stop:308 length:222 start_codon:yes stop_codon:yes gene_type:complete